MSQDVPFQEGGMPQVISVEEGCKRAGRGVQPVQHGHHLAAVLAPQNGPKARISERFKHLPNPVRTSVGGAVVEHDAFEILVTLRCNRTDR